MASKNNVARPTTWWVLKYISRMPLHRGSRQLASSLTWKRPIKQPDNMALFETFTGLAWETDCLFLCWNIRKMKIRIGTILPDEFYQEEGVPTGGVLAVTCFGLKINELPSYITIDVFRALFVDDLVICCRGRCLAIIDKHLQQAGNAIQEWATRNGFKFGAPEV